MQEQEENIQFDTMPDFRGMFSKQVNPDSTFDEKEYDSLYDELIEKCHPNRFISGEHFDEKLFEEANRLYAEVLKYRDSSEGVLISLRNRAMDILGVKISTKKKYEYLDSLLNPGVYTNVEADEYDSERVSEAARWYAILQKNRNDIRTLEALEIEASDFIDRRKNELSIIEQKEATEREEAMKQENERRAIEEEEKESTEYVVALVIIVVIIIIIIIIAVSQANK